MNEHQLTKIIQQGEGISTEFKTCRNQLSRDVYETVCAFLNRHGGTILLGVQDSGEVAGINADAIGQIKKDFITAINNPQKIHPPAYLSVDDVAVKGRAVLRIYVPESSQVHRCNGRIYDRNEDGDLDITEGDIFRIVVKVPEFGTTEKRTIGPKSDPSRAQVTGEVTGEVAGEVAREVGKLLSVMTGEMKRTELQSALGLKHEDHFREAYLTPALKADFIEMTIPDKPRSSKQRYRLTEKGRRVLAENQEDTE